MNREETIEMLQEVGNALAKKYGYEDITIGEDRQKGFWGESMTEMLEQKYGECSKEVKWCDPANKDNYIQFRFRFANPVICRHTFSRGDEHESMASMEFSDAVADWTHYDELRPRSKSRPDTLSHHVDWVNTGDFKCTDMQIWGDKGMDFFKELEEAIVTYQNNKNFGKENSFFCGEQDSHFSGIVVRNVQWEIDPAVPWPDTFYISKDKAKEVLESEDAIDFVIAELEKQYGKVESCAVLVCIGVPFSDVVFVNDDTELGDIIAREDLFNVFDEYSSSLTAEVPVHLLKAFYNKQIKQPEDSSLYQWLYEESTLDDTDGMLLWMEQNNSFGHFSGFDCIVDGKKRLEDIRKDVNKILSEREEPDR